jgi:hypothetical protein
MGTVQFNGSETLAKSSNNGRILSIKVVEQLYQRAFQPKVA